MRLNRELRSGNVDDENRLKRINAAYERIDTDEHRKTHASKMGHKKAEAEARDHAKQAKEREAAAKKRREEHARTQDQAKRYAERATGKVPPASPPPPGAVPPRQTPAPPRRSSAKPPPPGSAPSAPPSAPPPSVSVSRGAGVSPWVWFGLVAFVLYVVIALATSGGSSPQSSASSGTEAVTTPTAPAVSPGEERTRQEAAMRRDAESRIAGLSLRCLQKYFCRLDPEGHRLPVFIDGMDENLRTYLEKVGYRDHWSDSAGGIDGQTIGPYATANGDVHTYEYVAHEQEAGGGEQEAQDVGTGMLYNELNSEGTHSIAFEGGTNPSDGHGGQHWTLIWTLLDPEGHVARRLAYSIEIASCSAKPEYCELVKNYGARLEEEHSTLAPQENYSYSAAVYRPPTPFKPVVPVSAVPPKGEMNLGKIANVHTQQLSPTKVRITWDDPHDPAVVGFIVTESGPEGNTSGDNTGEEPSATSKIDDITTWESQFRPKQEQLWQFCVSPYAKINGERQEISGRQGCANAFRWK